MDDKKWEKFFLLISEIVEEKKTIEERIKELMSQAVNSGREGDFEEFLSWFVEF